MLNLIKNNEIAEPVKKRGRPKKVFTKEQLEQLEAKLIEKELNKKKGKQAKTYTKDEVLKKIEHYKVYQASYAKKNYIKKKKPSTINHSIAKKYKIVD